MKILIVSDAWKPQINGVVRTLESTLNELAKIGHEIRLVGPDSERLFTFPMPFYPEIRLDFFSHGRLAKILRDFSPDATHIATEGPLGWAARSVCLRQHRPFTTSYQTNFPDYLAKRAPRFLAPLVSFLAYAVLRRFHAPSGAVMVTTSSIEIALRKRNFRRLVRWSRGVDTDLFKPYGKSFNIYDNLPRPILLNVGRVSVEKNLHDFLDLNTLGSKVVIGDGPDMKALRHHYPQAHFLGAMSGESLARAYAAADVFVFPSKTETFGLVLLEACASGLRCAAYPVAGPADIFFGEKGKDFVVLDENLQKAVDCALSLPDNPENPRAFAAGFSWGVCAREFLAHLSEQGKE
jgi:glycosyltransferase involved in cell wall biosynthesis